MRKLISIAILISMTLHGSGRFELLSFLYQQRHSMARSIGFISEIPIAMCSSDYDSGTELKLDVVDGDQQVPTLALANEINLFFISVIDFQTHGLSMAAKEFIEYTSNDYRLTAIRAIFHPPTT